MKSPTPFFRIAAFTVGVLLAGASYSQTLNSTSSMAVVTIAQPFEVAPGKNPAEVRKAMLAMASVIRKMPGLVDDVVLENKSTANQPSHVHVMRWKDQRSWESMFGNADFQKALRENATYFKVDAARIFTPMP